MEQVDFKIKVKGEVLSILPKDLYIPPEALEVFLEAFEGPLDLLLYLIKKQNINILGIPIAEITRQYMQYVEMMKELHLELAAEYLVMAVMLAEIKSRMLLPRPETGSEDEEDPRSELVRRLQQYERFKKAAEDLDTLPRLNRDNFLVTVKSFEYKELKPLPKVTLQDLVFAFRDVLVRAVMYADHHVQREMLSTRERMAEILLKMQNNRFMAFADLFRIEEGKAGVIVTFTAILELIRQAVIEIVQTQVFGIIHIKKAGT